MKIGINTVNDYSNYGNRLQNYALQVVLEDMGNEVTTIRNYTDNPISKLQKVRNSVENGTFLTQIVNTLKKRKIPKISTKSDDIRKSKFLKFTRDYIKESKFILNENTVDFSFDDNFDCYVIGSDQVWNYNFSNRFSKYDFIEYSKKPKISYAASFGIDSIPRSYMSLYKGGLQNINHISVREQEGQKIVHDLIGKSAMLVLDPTLLIEKEEWLKLLNNRPIYHEKYLLIYFLGELSNVDRDYIIDFAKKRNLIIKELGNRENRNLWETDPIDFINLIFQADEVFTDSFHGTVFSIIFNKKFEVFSRKEFGQPMNSRISTLLNVFNLTDCWHGKSNDYQIDYDAVNELLKMKRLSSLNYLKKSLDDSISL
ncbi:polysaccharide pyruvyl transferase family protein [Companilactobacillus nantensis]|uniref:Polysaccharide pyruvyl transferase domain-containing protein n=1 Tax=Companilactobacillus nantensis DSM 16982 TaxID=1423774 RepID=A0A0R1WCN6_9LACO|nr:polysaccharide pyruvyl transferase family protein [Companilactobacillus nantensis]KRM15285.1 hypothetical protein FD31_GL001293 [Companilactobacillus nantensis DSM 16982]GEO64386.1 hypothetical protein LNA01_15690 [Companilactobacillus nantensis]